MGRIVLAIFFLSLAFAPMTSYSSVMEYRIEFMIDGVSVYDPYPPISREGLPLFQEEPLLGEVYFGRFSFEESQAVNSALYLDILVSSFRMEMEGLVWDPFYTGEVLGSSLYYSNGPMESYDPALGMNVMSGLMTLSFENGVITNWYGQMGGGDAPYIGAWGSRFTASDGHAYVQGSMSFTHIPEPSTLHLFGIGLLGLAILKVIRAVSAVV